MALPVVITSAGLQPQSPAAIRADLVARVSEFRPDYTANLPGSLIEDVASTDTIAIIECDTARVETVNSLTPAGANAFLLRQLGQMLGVPIGQASFTSVFVTFLGDPGFVIGKGFIVSDGTFQYTIQDGGIVASNGQTDPLFAIATVPGTWAVPAGTVTTLITSVPTTVTLSCFNQTPGVPGVDNETEESYRARVLQANLAASQGMARYLRTLLSKVSGVQTRLIQPLQRDDGGWMIIVGGGDPYQVAYAIYTALFDISTLKGSQLFVSTITNALPAVVTTFLNHGLLPGNAETIAGVTPSGFNGNFRVVAVVDEKRFSIGKDYARQNLVTQSWASTGGGQNTYTVGSPHGITVGSTVQILGSTPAGYNGTFVAIAGTSGTTIVVAQPSNPGASSVLGQLQPGVSLFDSTGLGAYVSGGEITPNPRNITVSIQDYPDTFKIPIIIPPLQTVTINVNWGTTLPNFVADTAVAQLAGPAITDYINSIVVGQPINILQLEDAFQTAVASLLSPQVISVLTFDVSINGIGTLPVVGTKLINGDPQSYFFAIVSGIGFTKVP